MKEGVQMVYMSLRKASQQTSLSYYRLRQDCLNGRFPFVRAGNRFLVSPEQISEALAREAVNNQQRQRQQAAAQAQQGA